ncbi:MAG: twin-arginine translocase TatA/TatE family subunit [Xanthomonadales bacterium]|nr:twin-arginine translocase TatA/TatE family subunit [Xanthomonadales bacterium]
MGSWSIGHWIVVAIVLVLLFGTKRLKNLGGDLGSAMRDFRKSFKDSSQDDAPAGRLEADPPEPAKAAQGEKDKVA